MVGRHHHAATPLGVRQQQRLQRLDAIDVDGGEGLVEHPQSTRCQVQSRQGDAPLLTSRQLLGRDILEAGKPHGVQRCPGERASLRGVSRRCSVTERLIPGKILQCRQRALDAGLVTQIEQ